MSQLEVRVRGAPSLCVFCRHALEGDTTECPGCGAALHAACAAELGRCPTLGCRSQLGGSGAPAPRRADAGLACVGIGVLVLALLAGLYGIDRSYRREQQERAAQQRAAEQAARDARRREREDAASSLGRWLAACAAAGREPTARASCALLWVASARLRPGFTRDRLEAALRQATATLEGEPLARAKKWGGRRHYGPRDSALKQADGLVTSALGALDADPQRAAELLREAGRCATRLADGDAASVLELARAWYAGHEARASRPQSR